MQYTATVFVGNRGDYHMVIESVGIGNWRVELEDRNTHRIIINESGFLDTLSAYHYLSDSFRVWYMAYYTKAHEFQVSGYRIMDIDHPAGEQLIAEIEDGGFRRLVLRFLRDYAKLQASDEVIRRAFDGKAWDSLGVRVPRPYDFVNEVGDKMPPP